MQFFWVNLGTTHREAKNCKFLWAPLNSQTSNGNTHRRTHWENVGKVKAGDLIFCYHNNYVRAIARAERDAYRSERPSTRAFNEWNHEGFRVDITLETLNRPLLSKSISAAYQTQFDSRTTPTLFNSTGGVNQIYMAQLPADAAYFLMEQAEVITKYEDLLINAGAVSRVNETTREALIRARLGQGTFRAEVMKRWEGKCALTGVRNPNLLVASHIHAWSLANNHARLDADNGLLLATHIDRLFDCGLISFHECGQLIISDSLTAEEQKVFGLTTFTSIDTLNAGNRLYLAKHRERFKLS
ncbi:HNH endonuclease [Pseudomonas alkylphenolica]|jgi:putative restriction endonuclease|uniref:HNH endonuclease n=1 Tax=Pseudomonas alkylphenolica TaxID=237609 RepID=UPI00315D9CEA